VRALVYQALLAVAVGLAAWYLIANTAHNLEKRGITSGFQFLSREAGFEISETTFLSYDAASTYLRAIAVGFCNTIRVAAIGIMLATMLGALIGLARLTRNWLVVKLAGGYVEVIRNVPLLVQLFFWYAVITEYLPTPAEALNPLPGIFVTNRGVFFPVPRWHAVYAWLGAALVAGIACALVLKRFTARKQALIAGAAVALAVALFLIAGARLEMSHPELAGFNFSGGGALSPEFAALLLGLAIYTAAFIAEIVRAGVLAVERGQFEAASSLGLSRWRAMRLVILPQALRAIVPPLTSQYLNITKNSSLAVAIGYPDLVSIANTTINQTGQAIEGIAIIMLVYLTISLTLSALMNWYNRRIALKGAKA
jgi:general L-amino acid transport system permease protein